MNATQVLPQARRRIEGLIATRSEFGFEATIDRLAAAITAHGLRIFARIDHAALAAEVGLLLQPTGLIIFGNPRAGTLLMQANETIGIDLPLKALVRQDLTGTTWVYHDDPAWLAKRHDLSEAERVITAMTLSLGILIFKSTNGIESKTPPL
jgi:uncharacterized protein (DUF302 family)